MGNYMNLVEQGTYLSVEYQFRLKMSRLSILINQQSQRHQLMSKKNLSGPKDSRQNSKKVPNDEQKQALRDEIKKEADPVAGRRRLKKEWEINSSEQLVVPHQDEDELTEKLPEDQLDQVEIPKRSEVNKKPHKKEEDKAQPNEDSRGTSNLHRFLQKHIEKDAEKKEVKPEKPKVQVTLDSMFKKKPPRPQPSQLALPIKKKKTIQDFIANDSSDISQDDVPASKFNNRQKVYEQYNGSEDDEAKLIEKALKLSLASASPHKKGEHMDLNDYSFKESKQGNKKYEEKKVESKKQVPMKASKQIPMKTSKEEKKEVKSKSKPKPAAREASKDGPLSGYVIVLTGEFQPYSKDQLIQLILQLGGECPKSITKKCNLLIQGAYAMDFTKRRINTPMSETRKSKQAREKNIRIIQFKDIDSFFVEKSGLDVESHITKNKVQPIPITSYMSQNPEERSKNGLGKMEIEDLDKPRVPVLTDFRLWTQKYSPSSLEEVLGQNSQIRSLREWLQNWQDIQIRGNKRQAKETKGWAAAGSINSKAALISGDPGIGKTTTARLLAMQYNYAISEFNASDVRNKSGVNLMQTGSFNLITDKILTKSLIIMDQVDGMSSGDRGGIAAIINMIKKSKIPIICICNDRASEKIRSLAAHCLDVKFHKPPKNILSKRLKQILIKQGGSGEERVLEQLVQTFQNDMRQILSYLELIFRTITKRITLDVLTRRNQHAKDASVMVNHFDSTRRLLNRYQFSRMRISQRVECFFIDSDIVPLMVHQNLYASAKKIPMNNNQFHSLVKGLKGIVVGDLLDKSIRKQQEWGLMPSYGFMSCVYSTEKISEAIGYPQFPSWLGKNSSQRKMKRLARQFKNCIFPTTLCSNWKVVKSTYAPIILKSLIELLKREDIEQACILMETYKITPTILAEHLATLYFTTDKTSPFADVSSQAKSKLTRLFNKRHEQARMNKKKGQKQQKVEHLKYDPVLEQAEDIGIDEQQISDKQDNEDSITPVAPNAKSKGTKAKKN